MIGFLFLKLFIKVCCGTIHFTGLTRDGDDQYATFAISRPVNVSYFQMLKNSDPEGIENWESYANLTEAFRYAYSKNRNQVNILLPDSPHRNMFYTFELTEQNNTKYYTKAIYANKKGIYKTSKKSEEEIVNDENKNKKESNSDGFIKYNRIGIIIYVLIVLGV
ncbi:hypothetical protein TCON_0193 [Astathelohania contejeani]|uniref:Uncharacterized protein n=1 Tax=Astathelohania contejeani TaxID=164912 RepID=A0ABQ7I277_9MICR|nr:hypothetical protein TCON_0193 [Thelohania contejeani]